ncbi:sugar ABC transporter substrate-binding protein [Agrococcus sp. Marseille-Q4369]|uniref:ABC transporter substrate-binding protein n=1 Tax=Agrococcus sp. Marseille-Q4369 TaxID=2810513 RepID=UPI001B8D93FC|nr:sugar ABC transporter substrate-binding protein [Agrococcus sp. Marseille-Q4369]QUW18115.1 sugar ABC transporter substrate-binding protein [Agrococcus sp. Marseille-Q4369]
MDKRIALPAAATVALLALTACSGGGGTGGGASEGASGERSTVTVWMYPVIPDETASQEYWSGVEEDFEAENDTIDLEIELQPWDNRDEKIATALASGRGPDLVLLTADQTLNYYGTGGLQPLDDAIEPDAFYPQTIDAVTYDGSVYGYPIYQTSTTTAYNTELFEQAGIELPTTWDDVLAAAPVLAEQGVAVMDYSGSPNMTLNLSFYPLLWQAGGTVFTEDGTDVAFDSQEGVAALQFLMDLQEAGGLPADAATKANAIEGGPLGTGGAAMGYAVTLAEVRQMQTALGEETVAVGEPLTGEEQATFGTPGVLALTSISENPEAAGTVAQYIGSAEVSSALHQASGTYPVLVDAEVSSDDEDVAQFVAALEHARPGEVVPNARQVMAALSPHLQAALQGQVTAQEALAAAAAEARQVIERAP